MAVQMTGRFDCQRLGALSMDGLVALRQEVEATAKPGVGLYLIDKRSRDKLDAIAWAVINKLTAARAAREHGEAQEGAVGRTGLPETVPAIKAGGDGLSPAPSVEKVST